MEILEEWPIQDNIKIAKVTKLPEQQYTDQINQYLLQTHPALPWQGTINETQREKLQSLRKRVSNRYELRLALLHNNNMVGWSYGWQDSIYHSDFYMAASLVLPEYRKQGFYSQLVQRVLEETKQEGFIAVRSRHIMTNNPVLIAKLKLGFVIHGFEQDDSLGTLIRMVFHHNQMRRDATEFRAGNTSHRYIWEKLIDG